MVEELQKTAKLLEERLPLISKAIEETDVTTEAYRKLLDAYNGTMMLVSNMNQALAYAPIEEEEK